MSLRDVVMKLRRSFTFHQFMEVTDLLHRASELSKEQATEQEVRITFINGHPKSYHSTSNRRASLPDNGGDDDLFWEMG